MSPLVSFGHVAVIVPPFSRSVRIQRFPFNTPIRMEFWQGGGLLYRVVDLSPNEEGNTPIDAACAAILIYNMAAFSISSLQAVFDVTPT
jgi:hypothetical protein